MADLTLSKYRPGGDGACVLELPDGETVTLLCHWFAGCDREATQAVDHPILGPVPTCDRCAARTDEREDA